MTVGAIDCICHAHFMNFVLISAGIQSPTSCRGNLHPKNTFPMPNLPKSNYRARKLRNPTANAEHEKRTRPKQYEKWPRAALRGTLGCLFTLHAWATRSWARARPTGTQPTATHKEGEHQTAHGTWHVATPCVSVSGA